MICTGHDTNCNCDGSCRLANLCRAVWGEARGWQVRAAKELGVTPQTVNNWVHDRAPVPQAVRLLIAERLNKKPVDDNQ